MNWLIDHIPIWGWIIIIGLPVMAAFYFASPVLIPLWNVLPKWLKVTLGVIAAVFIAFMGGRYRGRANAEEEDRRRNAEALRKRQEVDNETNRMLGGDVDKKLRDRWSRDDP
jgi:hypothetical protein